MLIEDAREWREWTAFERKKHNFAALQSPRLFRRGDKEEEVMPSPQSIDVLLTITHMG